MRRRPEGSRIRSRRPEPDPRQRPMSPLSAAARSEWSRQLVRALVTAGYAGEDDLVPLLNEATQTGSQVGPIIISRQLVPAPVVVSLLAQLSRLPKADLHTTAP